MHSKPASPLRTYLDECRALADAAAPGPWYYDCGNGQVESHNKNEMRKPIADRCNEWDIGNRRGEYIGDADETCDFIAASREAIPRLLEMVEKCASCFGDIEKIGKTEYAGEPAWNVQAALARECLADLSALAGKGKA